jgi:hydroxymethylglutaryl-CoA lyase
LFCNGQKKLTEIGVEEIALSDTIGVAEPDLIESLFKLLVKNLKGIEISAHFHSSPNYWEEKVRKAFDAGCLSFDSAIGGFGGCPLAEDKLVGNLATENLVDFFSNQLRSEFNLRNFQASVNLAKEIFG